MTQRTRPSLGLSSIPRRAIRTLIPRQALGQAERAARAARHAVIVSSARHVQALLEPRGRTAVQARHARYWQLVGQGHSNTEACKIMHVHPKTGRNIRRRGDPSKHPTQMTDAGRYLTLPERLQIADLVGHDVSLRAIAVELGRSPSTISRELDRHRDEHGRYQPHQAEQSARQQRRRPLEPKLLADIRLREIVQRKLNRYWSPARTARRAVPGRGSVERGRSPARRGAGPGIDAEVVEGGQAAPGASREQGVLLLVGVERAVGVALRVGELADVGRPGGAGSSTWRTPPARGRRCGRCAAPRRASRGPHPPG